jgi:hypothetical protein
MAQHSPDKLTTETAALPIQFKELRNLSHFLENKMKIISQKTASQKKMFKIASHAAHDIRTPISILSILSYETEKKLDAKDWCIYKNALTEIQITADDLLSLQKKAADQKESPAPKVSHFQYAAILLVNFITKKSREYSSNNIKLTCKVDSSAWFTLADIETEQFHDLISQLINNEAERVKNETDKQIFCTIHYQLGDSTFTLSVKHSDVDSQNINLPVTRPTPQWWTNQITLPKTGSIILFDDDPLSHQQWEDILASYLAQLPNVCLYQCYTEADFIESLKHTDEKLILIDHDIQRAPKSGLDYIRELNLNNCAILVTNNYYYADIQSQCEMSGVYLLPKPLVTYATIKISK